MAFKLSSIDEKNGSGTRLFSRRTGPNAESHYQLTINGTRHTGLRSGHQPHQCTAPKAPSTTQWAPVASGKPHAVGPAASGKGGPRGSPRKTSPKKEKKAKNKNKKYTSPTQWAPAASGSSTQWAPRQATGGVRGGSPPAYDIPPKNVLHGKYIEILHAGRLQVISLNAGNSESPPSHLHGSQRIPACPASIRAARTATVALRCKEQLRDTLDMVTPPQAERHGEWLEILAAWKRQPPALSMAVISMPVLEAVQSPAVGRGDVVHLTFRSRLLQALGFTALTLLRLSSHNLFVNYPTIFDVANIYGTYIEQVMDKCSTPDLIGTETPFQTGVLLARLPPASWKPQVWFKHEPNLTSKFGIRAGRPILPGVRIFNTHRMCFPKKENQRQGCYFCGNSRSDLQYIPAQYGLLAPRECFIPQKFGVLFEKQTGRQSGRRVRKGGPSHANFKLRGYLILVSDTAIRKIESAGTAAVPWTRHLSDCADQGAERQVGTPGLGAPKVYTEAVLTDLLWTFEGPRSSQSQDP
ncbi:hypothetical protein B0H11DRAFT_1936327 [Mycena galericulata]|nr:hypothetical protein B0H11DRAFT_1936327 [Mycena galericulata]